MGSTPFQETNLQICSQNLSQDNLYVWGHLSSLPTVHNIETAHHLWGWG